MAREPDDVESNGGLGLAETMAPPQSQNDGQGGLKLRDPNAPISGLEATVAPASSQPPATGVTDSISLRTVDPADYAVGDEIARGGMGRIRRAQDLRLGRPVAVKELLATAPEMVSRFEREIRLTARLQHPSIVSVYEAGRWPSGEPFFAMRVVPGKSLDQVVAPKKKLAERLALVPNVIAIVEALAYAHDQRIIHRDLKPGNILIGPFGETVVIDWGLGKDLASGDDSVPPPTRAERPSVKSIEPKLEEKQTSSQGENLTTAGSVMGTLAYMPPEQASGDIVDERADVYSLGAILYHVLAGRPPFVGRGHDDLMLKVLSRSPAKLSGIDENIPQDLIAIVEKAMAREAKDRYPTAGELAEDLRRFHTGQLVRAHDYSYWALVRRWVKQNRGAVSVAAAAVVTLAVVATVLIRNIVIQRDRAEDATKRANEQRAAAVAAKDQAEIAAARLHFDQGRQELLGGNPLEAAVLGRAALAGEDTPATRLVIGQALETLEPLIRRFDGLAEEVVATGFLPDGAHVFAATWHGKVRVWNVATGAVTAGFERPGRLIEAGITHDGKTIVMLSDESVIELWDIASGKKLRAITVEGGVAERVALSPDETRLAVGGDGITIWDPATGTKVGTVASVADESVSEMDWTADGGSMIVGDNDGNVAVIDTATWRPRMKTSVGDHAINDCSLSGDGKRLACVWRDGGVILDAKTGRPQVALDSPGQGRQASYRAIEWSEGSAVLSVSTAGASARLIDSTTGHTQAVFDTAAVAMFGPDDEVLTFGPSAAHVAIWDKDGKRLVDEIA
ncbi:MAG TPA: serine/threonine-protein kinase, partial [Kofleriaceae bacterium]